jgi:hypothetical protein
MDHKVSKDMISSGMIPSGEKTQADLGRTQYGSAPSPSSLMDAYRAIYEHHQKDADGNVIPHEEKEELNEGKMPEGLKNYLMKKKGKKEDKKEEMKKESVDLFDLVKGKLIDEGCEEKEALKIMANMTKEEFDEVSEGLAGMALKLGGAALGAYGAYKAGQKMGTKGSGPQPSQPLPKLKPSPQPKPSKPVKQPGLIQKLKDRTSATNKVIEQM